MVEIKYQGDQVDMNKMKGSLESSLDGQTNGLVFKTKENQVAELMRERILAGLFERGQKLRQAS